MSKNSLKDLNSYLFDSLDALSNPDLSEDQLKLEVVRAKSITNVGRAIIDNAKVVLDATKHADEFGYGAKSDKRIPDLITGK